MPPLPRKIDCFKVFSIGGDESDGARYGLEEKKPERIQVVERQAAQEKGSAGAVFRGEQGGDDESATEGHLLGEARARIPVDKGRSKSGLVGADPISSSLFARVDGPEISTRMKAGRESGRPAPLLVAVHQQMKPAFNG